MNQEVERLVRLVGSLLSLARADAGQIVLEHEQVNLGELLESAVSAVRAAAEEKRIALNLQQGEDVRLMADQDLLLQLVLNLLDNALKYTPEDGTVEASWSVEGGQAIIRISDTGSGIAPEHLGGYSTDFIGWRALGAGRTAAPALDCPSAAGSRKRTEDRLRLRAP